MKRAGYKLREWQWVLLLSLPAWVVRLAFFRRYVYMGFDQARDSFVFNEMAKGVFPAYGPYALSGGYFMPNYYYRFYGALNILDKADPAYQAFPFAVLSAAGVAMAMWLVWLVAAQAVPKLGYRAKLSLTAVPLVILGFSYNELINIPLMWNPVNLVFWQVALFLIYVRIQRRHKSWKRAEAVGMWAGFGAVSVLAASMHGTFLYAVPLWAAGLLGYHLVRRQWLALAYGAGAAAALVPFIRVESRNGYKNILAMAGRGGQDSSQLQGGLDFNVLQNLWNNLGQFAYKVVFGLEGPSVLWTLVLVAVMSVGLVLMAVKYRHLRWYAWWVIIYLAMASLFHGERGDTIVSWHYQQNIMLLPVMSVVVILLFAIRPGQAARVAHAGHPRTLLKLAIRWLLIGLLAVLAFGMARGTVRMMRLQYAAAYRPDHVLMTTYQMEDVIRLIPIGSNSCVPYGYYHPATFEYLAQHRLERTGDVFTDSCSTETQYYWLLKYYYSFWPPHVPVATRLQDIESYKQQGQTLYETHQYVLVKRSAGQAQKQD